MNHAQRSQKYNLIYFFASLVLALLVFAASAFLVKQILAGEVGETDKVSATCEALMRTQGFNPTANKDEIEATRPSTTNIESLVAEAGVAIALCPAYELEEFCAGAGCNPDGVHFKLKARPKQE